MSWIKTIAYTEATGALKKIYERIKGPGDKVDNVLSIHSLRPHTLLGHMTLYKAVLHNSQNTLPKWYLESIGVYVSILNRCDYCEAHHREGLRRLLADDDRLDAFLKAIADHQLDKHFDAKYFQGIEYARMLTQDLDNIQETAIDALRKVGFTDGEILEINQVTSYFNYVNRMVVGLGVNTHGDILGLSPNESNDPDNWSHQ